MLVVSWDFEVVLNGRRTNEVDRLWFRFFKTGSVCPSFGFSRRDGVIRLAMRDVDAEGVVNPNEPSFDTIDAAFVLVHSGLFALPGISFIERYEI